MVVVVVVGVAVVVVDVVAGIILHSDVPESARKYNIICHATYPMITDVNYKNNNKG